MFRPSVATKIESATVAIGRVLVGTIIAAVGGFFDYLEYKSPPSHTTHLAIFTGILLLGLLTAFSGLLLPVIKQTLIVVGPYLPTFGRRAGDVPAPPGVAPGTPVSPPPPPVNP